MDNVPASVMTLPDNPIQQGNPKHGGYMNMDSELLSKYSAKEAITNCINNILRIMDGSRPSSVLSTGFSALDHCLNGGFHHRQLIAIGAAPSIGKTAFAISLLRNMIKSDTKILFFSPEEPVSNIAKRLIASIAHLPLKHISEADLSDGNEFDRVMNAADIIYETDSLYFVDIPRVRIETLKAIARRLHYNESVNCIIIDDVDAITTEQYQIITEELKDLAMELDIPVVITFQGSRKEHKQGAQTGFADCRCTAERIAGIADTVIFLERDIRIHTEHEGDGRPCFQMAKAIVAKNSNGPQCTINLGFSTLSDSFENIAQPQDDEFACYEN